MEGIGNMGFDRFDLFIVINNFAAEGCPRLALNLIEDFKKRKLRILLITLNKDSIDLLEEFKKKDIGIKTFNLRNDRFYKYLRILYLSFILSRRYKPIAILSFPFGWHSLIAIGAKLSGVKNVTTHAGNIAPKFGEKNYWKFNTLVQLGRPFTNKIICCSKYVKSSVQESFYLFNSEITHIYNCYDEKVFAFKENYKIKIHKASLDKKIILCMVARLEMHKDHESLIKSIKILKEKNLNIKLLLIGDGSLRGFLETLTENLNLNNEVVFLGAIKNVSKKLDDVDIFVFSTTKDEGFGIALAEAMGKGVPIIASDVGACSEVLLNGKCGVLFDPKSPESIAKSVENILNKPNSTYGKVIAAYHHASNNFSKKKMANSYYNVLKIKK